MEINQENKINHNIKITHDMEINHNAEGLISNPVLINLENKEKKKTRIWNLYTCKSIYKKKDKKKTE